MRALAGRSLHGHPVISIVISVAVHAALLALLALTLSSVSRYGGGAVVSLDLGMNEPAAGPFEAPDMGQQSQEPATSEDDAAEVGRGLAAALERVATASMDTAVDASIRRGGAASGVQDGAAPLLDRGAVGASALTDLGTAASALDGASFAGVSARRANSVVYAVDASGAMITSLPFVLEELRRSVSALAPDQRFAVVLFGRRVGEDVEDAGVRRFPEEGLLLATPASKARLFTWLDGAQARGVSNPLDGLLAALERQPQVVFLLSRSIRRTDGREAGGDWGPGREAILAELDKANPVRKSIFGPPARAVQVKCLQFLEEDPTGVMRAIAEVHGGGPDSYRLLPETELRRR